MVPSTGFRSASRSDPVRPPTRESHARFPRAVSCTDSRRERNSRETFTKRGTEPARVTTRNDRPLPMWPLSHRRGLQGLWRVPDQPRVRRRSVIVHERVRPTARGTDDGPRLSAGTTASGQSKSHAAVNGSSGQRDSCGRTARPYWQGVTGSSISGDKGHPPFDDSQILRMGDWNTMTLPCHRRGVSSVPQTHLSTLTNGRIVGPASPSGPEGVESRRHTG